MLKIGDSLKVKHENYLLFLAGKDDKGISLVAFAGGEGAKRLGAGAAIKLAAPLLGGNGGGKDTMASGSAKDLSAFGAALNAIKAKL